MSEVGKKRKKDDDIEQPVKKQSKLKLGPFAKQLKRTLTPDRGDALVQAMHVAVPSSNPKYKGPKKPPPERSHQGQELEAMMTSYASNPRDGGQKWITVDMNHVSFNFPGIDHVLYDPETDELVFLQSKSHISGDSTAMARSYASDAASYEDDAENAAKRLAKNGGELLKKVVRQLEVQQQDKVKIPLPFQQALKAFEDDESEDPEGEAVEILRPVIIKNLTYPAPFDISESARSAIQPPEYAELIRGDSLISDFPVSTTDLQSHHKQFNVRPTRSSQQKALDEENEEYTAPKSGKGKRKKEIPL